MTKSLPLDIPPSGLGRAGHRQRRRLKETDEQPPRNPDLPSTHQPAPGSSNLCSKPLPQPLIF